MPITDLVGFTLEGCYFSKGSYTFEFCGKLEGQFKTFLVGTSNCFSGKDKDNVDAEKNFSAEVWDFLERDVTAISIEGTDEMPKVYFRFDNGAQFSIWAEEPLTDNLMLVTNPQTGEWYPVC